MLRENQNFEGWRLMRQKPPNKAFKRTASPPLNLVVMVQYMRFVNAIAACFGLFVVYAIIGGILGWKHGGGAMHIIIFFAVVIWTWNAITGTKGGANESCTKSV